MLRQAQHERKKLPMISILVPFALSSSKGERELLRILLVPY